jgi:O-antigen/teichoic acid export membrane protein
VKLLNIQGLKPYLWLLPIGMLLVSSYNIFSRIVLRMKSYGVIAKTKLIQGFSAPLSQIMLGLVQAGSLGLILGTIIGQSAGIVTFYSSFKKQITPRLQLHPLKNLAQRYKRFPQLSVIPALINAIGLSLPIFALNKIYGPEVTGFFSLMQRTIGVPLSIISTSTSQVLLSQAANFKRINSNMEPLFWKSLRQQALVSAPIFLLIPFMPYLFQIFFGSTWRTSGIYASVWLPALLGGFIFSPTGCFLDVLERQDLFIIRELIRLIIFIGATIIGSILKLKPLSMNIVFSIATVIFYFIYGLFSLYAI